MVNVLKTGRIELCFARLSVTLLLLGTTGCGHSFNRPGHVAKGAAVLEEMSNSWGPNLSFSQNFLRSFGKRHGIKTQFVPNSRLAVYQKLLRAHSGEPDFLELDVVWPSILAADLVDLKPYLKNPQEFAPHLLESYTVAGRLVALPAYVDLGVLYYRPELLEKYGFRHPPKTWDELAVIAGRIQTGERRAGKKDFWGYVWQGAATEGGTCNALEWQASAGAGSFIEPTGRVHVNTPGFIQALKRATNWIGVISPPAEYAYEEDDAVNLWDAGQTAFMRNWASGYRIIAQRPGKDRRHFEVTALPAGPGGRKGALGGMGIGVSKYAANRELAIEAVLEMSNRSNDAARQLLTEGISAHLDSSELSGEKGRSGLAAISPELISSVMPRPAILTGDKYAIVSAEYSKAVNQVLRRKTSPEKAMAELEHKLTALTGLPAEEN